MSTTAALNRPMTPREWAFLLTLSVLWGGSFFFVGIVVTALPPLTIVGLRVTLATFALLTILKVMGVRLPTDQRIWAAFLEMGLLNNVVPFTLIVWGQVHIASGVAAILNATTPLFTVIVAHFLTTDEKMTGGRIVGVLVGLAGVIVMIGGAASHTLGVNVIAQCAVLAAALSYAFAGVFGRRFRTMGVAPLVAATGQLAASTLVLLPLLLLVDRPWTLSTLSVEAVAALAGLSLLSTAVAYVLYFRILATAGATNLLLVTFLIPVTAILLGIVALDETLQINQLIGMILIGSGLAAIDGRPWRTFTRNLFLRKPAGDASFPSDEI